MKKLIMTLEYDEFPVSINPYDKETTIFESVNMY